MIRLLKLAAFSLLLGTLASAGEKRQTAAYVFFDTLLSSIVGKEEAHPDPIPTPSPAQKSVWKNCGAAGDIFQLESLALAPDPPIRGANLRVLVVGNLSEPLVGDESINLVVKFGVLTIIEKSANLCDELRKAALYAHDSPSDELPKCPIEKGPFLLDYSQLIPKEVPPVSAVFL